MANQLYSFTRLDSSGRVVAGSTVVRKKMPKTGRWRQDLSEVCCQAPLTSLLTGSVTLNSSDVTFTLFCDGVAVAVLASGQAGTTLASEITIANNKFSAYGEFTANGTVQADLRLKDDIADGLCPGGVVTFTIS